MSDKQQISLQAPACVTVSLDQQYQYQFHEQIRQKPYQIFVHSLIILLTYIFLVIYDNS